jgi:CBS domain-containing protein
MPIGAYPAVSEKATIRDALIALEKAEEHFVKKGDKPRAVLVLDDEDRIIGKMTTWDFLRALEPKYKSIGDEESVPQYGLDPTFLKSMVENYGLLEDAFHDICTRVAKIVVGDVMTPAQERDLVREERQIVEGDYGLNQAIHLFVMGNYQILFVREEGRIVGILRLVDVFNKVSTAIKNCPVEAS